MMEVEYFVDDRRTGRTKNIVADLFQETEKGRTCRVFVPHISTGRCVVSEIESRGIPQQGARQMVVSNPLDLRGLRIDTLYIDGGEYLNQSLPELLQACQPSRVVVVLTGKLYKRMNSYVEALHG